MKLHWACKIQGYIDHIYTISKYSTTNYLPPCNCTFSEVSFKKGMILIKFADIWKVSPFWRRQYLLAENILSRVTSLKWGTSRCEVWVIGNTLRSDMMRITDCNTVFNSCEWSDFWHVYSSVNSIPFTSTSVSLVIILFHHHHSWLTMKLLSPITTPSNYFNPINFTSFTHKIHCNSIWLTHKIHCKLPSLTHKIHCKLPSFTHKIHCNSISFTHKIQCKFNFIHSQIHCNLT